MECPNYQAQMVLLATDRDARRCGENIGSPPDPFLSTTRRSRTLVFYPWH